MNPSAALFVLALAISPTGSHGAELSPTASASRPILQASLQGLAEFGSSPLRIQKEDVPVLAYSSIGMGFLLCADVTLFSRMAKGDARKDWLDQSMPAVSTAGEGWVELSVALLGYGFGDDRLSRTSGVALQSLVVAGLYTELLKYAAWSNRPYQDDTQHRFLAYDQKTMGMPSGHSFAAFAVAEAYGGEYGRFIPYSLAAIIAYSRIYNQAHWPSDVFVGSGLGILAGAQARRLAQAHGAPALRFSIVQVEDVPVLVADLPF
jgi:membrane-associated phospholipid phosphatase